jgi:hypothetical protein
MLSPPPDVGSGAAAAPATPTRSTASSAEQGAPAPSGLSAALDRADIRPLEVTAALQILIAEVRAAFAEALPADRELAGVAGSAAVANIDSAVPAARVIVEMVLQSLPETFEPNSWSAALPRADLALQAGVQRALDAVSAWLDVTPAVLDATKEAGSLALRLIAEEPPYPSWPPPEWLGMAPRLTRLWRRRRALRRRLLDPDYEAYPKGDELDDRGS